MTLLLAPSKVHVLQIGRFGVVPEVRDRNVVEGALSSSRNLFHYDEVVIC